MVCSWHPSLEQVPGIWENISWLATLWQNKDTTTIWMRVRGNALMKTTSQLSANTSPRLAVQFSQSVVSDSLRPHRLQHTRFLCPSPTPGACLNSCPSSQWCHPTVSSSITPFPSCPQSFPASRSLTLSLGTALPGRGGPSRVSKAPGVKASEHRK